MPRPAKNTHVIRKIREALKLPRDRLATLVGVGASRLKQIELDDDPMSPELVSKIHEATGVDIWEISKGATGEALACLRLSGKRPLRILTKELWQEWRSIRRKSVSLCLNSGTPFDDDDDTFYERFLPSMQIAFWIWDKLSPATRSQWEKSRAPASDIELRKVVLRNLGRLVEGESFLNDSKFPGMTLSSKTQALRAHHASNGGKATSLNRHVLGETFPSRTADDDILHQAAQLGELSRLLMLAASHQDRSKLYPVFRSAFRAMTKICNDFDLGQFFVEEWEKRFTVEVFTKGKGMMRMIDSALPELLLLDVPAMASRLLGPPPKKRSAARGHPSRRKSKQLPANGSRGA